MARVPTAGHLASWARFGRSTLVIVWHLLADPNCAIRTWPRFYDTHVNAERAKRNHVRQLEALGYRVTLVPAA